MPGTDTTENHWARRALAGQHKSANMSPNGIYNRISIAATGDGPQLPGPIKLGVRALGVFRLKYGNLYLRL